MKNLSKKSFANASLVMLLMVVAGSANAELPAWFGTAAAAGQADLLSLIAIMGPLIVGAAVAWKVPSWGKKGINKLG